MLEVSSDLGAVCFSLVIQLLFKNNSLLFSLLVSVLWQGPNLCIPLFSADQRRSKVEMLNSLSPDLDSSSALVLIVWSLASGFILGFIGAASFLSSAKSTLDNGVSLAFCSFPINATELQSLHLSLLVFEQRIRKLK